MGLLPIDLMALKDDATLARFQRTGDAFQERALSRPIGPNEDHHLSVLHFDAYIVDGENSSVSRGDLFYRQHLHHRFRPR